MFSLIEMSSKEVEMFSLQRQTVHGGLQQAGQRGDKFSPEKPNCGKSVTELDMGV